MVEDAAVQVDDLLLPGIELVHFLTNLVNDDLLNVHLGALLVLLTQLGLLILEHFQFQVLVFEFVRLRLKCGIKLLHKSSDGIFFLNAADGRFVALRGFFILASNNFDDVVWKDERYKLV